MAAGSALPPPCPDQSRVVVPAPGDGPGHWAGGPSAVLDGDGTFWLAYRLRRPVGAGRGYANVVARSVDGVEFETVTVLDRDEFGSESLERPALVGRPTAGMSPPSDGPSVLRHRPVPAGRPLEEEEGGSLGGCVGGHGHGPGCRYRYGCGYGSVCL